MMNYNSLKSAIPKEWIQSIKPTDINSFEEITTINLSINGKPKLLHKVKCKDLYNIFVLEKYTIPTAIHKWESIYSNHAFEWEDIFHLPYKLCRETSLQSVQYKILSRYIPCKANLHRWNKAPYLMINALIVISVKLLNISLLSAWACKTFGFLLMTGGFLCII